MNPLMNGMRAASEWRGVRPPEHGRGLDAACDALLFRGAEISLGSAGTAAGRRTRMIVLGIVAWVAVGLPLLAWTTSSLSCPGACDPVGRQTQESATFGRREETDAYRALVKRLGQDLAAGRSTLAEAVEQLGRSEALAAVNVMPVLRLRLENRSDAECLATVLIDAALPAETSPIATEQLAARLRAEFEATYRRPAPTFGRVRLAD